MPLIRAHLATFPPRKAILLETVERIAPQVDRLFIALNEYAEVPVELTAYNNVEVVIPEVDMKDLGKFLFVPAADDIVFTIDDDIYFPPDYVQNTLRHADKIGLERNVIGYHAHAWVFKNRKNAFDWRNFMFFHKVNKTFSVDLLGTGTACMSGANLPPLDFVKGSMCFVDTRFAQWQQDKGNTMWTLEREGQYLRKNLPDSLQSSNIFNTFTRHRRPESDLAMARLMQGRTVETGKPWRPRSGVIKLS